MDIREIYSSAFESFGTTETSDKEVTIQDDSTKVEALNSGNNNIYDTEGNSVTNKETESQDTLYNVPKIVKVKTYRLYKRAPNGNQI